MQKCELKANNIVYPVPYLQIKEGWLTFAFIWTVKIMSDVSSAHLQNFAHQVAYWQKRALLNTTKEYK